MCRPGALLPGLLLALLAGCAMDHAAPAGALVDRLRGLARMPPDAVELVVAVIERRRGDPYLNDDLWTFTDEQVVDLDRKSTLEDNGFRVGQIVGMTPSGLQSLLTSERACSNPLRYLLGSGKPKSIVLGTTVPHARFNVQQQGEPIEVSLDEAQFTLVVLPSLTGDGRTRLHFTPEVAYGENVHDFRVAPDGSGYMMEIKRPCKTFADLSWDVDLAPNQYVIIGGRLDLPDRLGHACFVQSDGPTAVQRLLVIRTNRAAAPQEQEEDAAAVAAGHPVPLALQATLPEACGSGP